MLVNIAGWAKIVYNKAQESTVRRPGHTARPRSRTAYERALALRAASSQETDGFGRLILASGGSRREWFAPPWKGRLVFLDAYDENSSQTACGQTEGSGMEELKRRILSQAVVGEGDIIHVDMFLNHCIDVALMERMGEVLAKRFRGEKITKVLTVESSGIALACFTARGLGVPAVYAKRFRTGYIDPDVYSAEAHSFTMDKTYTMRVSKKYLDQDDVVLVVDDILSNGQSALGMLELVSKAGGEVAGVAVAIEKSMREGGRVLRRMGVRVEALATVERVEDGRIILQ